MVYFQKVQTVSDQISKCPETKMTDHLTCRPGKAALKNPFRRLADVVNFPNVRDASQVASLPVSVPVDRPIDF